MASEVDAVTQESATGVRTELRTMPHYARRRGTSVYAAQAAQAKLGGAHSRVRALCGAAPRGSSGEIGGVGAGAEAPPLTPTHTDDIESPTHLERLEEVVVLGEISAALGSDAHGAGGLEA